jgi:hypothetical protein
MDSTEVRAHGQQEQSAYNGHFESTCYQAPLPPFIDGFVEIVSPLQLSVAAVYTSQTCTNPANKCSVLGDLSLEVVPQSAFRDQ